MVWRGVAWRGTRTAGMMCCAVMTRGWHEADGRNEVVVLNTNTVIIIIINSHSLQKHASCCVE